MDKFPVIVFFYIISCLNNYVIHFQRTELRKYLKKTHKDKVCSEKVSSYRPEKNLLERGKLNRRLLTTRRDTQMSWKSVLGYAWAGAGGYPECRWSYGAEIVQTHRHLGQNCQQPEEWRLVVQHNRMERRYKDAEEAGHFLDKLIGPQLPVRHTNKQMICWKSVSGSSTNLILLYFFTGNFPFVALMDLF